MKKLLRTVAAYALAVIARLILRKYKPLVVMVTGSVGKTSTKDAVAAALGKSFYLRASEKSYNSEFGVPFTIIGTKNPWHDPVAWLRAYKQGIALILLPSHYPKLLVLEVGADRPGDLRHILRIATPDAVVVTQLPEVPVHVEAYASPEAVREEEFAPAHALPPGGPLVISSDDPHAVRLAEPLAATVSTFGFAESATVRLRDADTHDEGRMVTGMEARIEIEGESHPLVVQGALGVPQLYAPAAAIAVALALKVPLADAFAGLADYVPPPGRTRILAGKDGAVLVDDSYNSSPKAVEASLSALELIPRMKRRIAVLGDMLELGRYSAEEHRRIGALAASKVDMVVAVGVRARALAEAAEQAGLPQDAIRSFATSAEAGAALAEIVGKGDAVLVKGSQGVRMERVVAALLANPTDMEKLVRQDKEWKLIK